MTKPMYLFRTRGQHTTTNKRQALLFCAILMALCLVSCSSSEEEAYNSEEKAHDNEPHVETTTPSPINFATEVEENTEHTRGGHVGILNTLGLQSYGFGVYAYHTGYTAWETAKTTAQPNFMYNQHVEWNYVGTDGTRDWVYSPVKYWPNDNQPADAASPAAQGSTAHSYLSFFAYAPYFGDDDGTMPAGETTGIISESANTATGAPTITYIWEPDNIVDLMWASQKDNFKTQTVDGSDDAYTPGYVNGKVNLAFHHALAAVQIKVERIYDEVDDTELKPSPIDSTKILVSNFTLTADGLKSQGTLDLSNGTWSAQTGSVNYAPELTGEAIVESLRGTTSTTESYIRDIELDTWRTAPGVTAIPQLLHPAGNAIVIVPQNVTFTPTITYSLVTRDDALELDYIEDSGYSEGTRHRYHRIVNTVQGTLPELTLEGGKIYTVLCKIGVEHVSFQVTNVVDWDFPMRFTPTTTPFTADTNEIELNED